MFNFSAFGWEDIYKMNVSKTNEHLILFTYVCSFSLTPNMKN